MVKEVGIWPLEKQFFALSFEPEIQNGSEEEEEKNHHGDDGVC